MSIPFFIRVQIRMERIRNTGLVIMYSVQVPAVYFIVCIIKGKLRLQKWYEAKEVQEKKKIVRELTSTILSRLIILFYIFVFKIILTVRKLKFLEDLLNDFLFRKPKMSNFLEFRDLQVVYKRYASLFFCFAVDRSDNELGALEVIHRWVLVSRPDHG